jgi:aminocarboxymuconate-semialdehyde decarboxylase
MHDTDLACRELERAMTHLSMRGVQIGTHIGGVNLDEPGPKRILARAAELNASVFIHPWDMLGSEGGDKSRLARYWMPWLVGMPTETTIAIMSVLFGGVLDASPNLRCCFAHGGGSFPGTIGRISHGLAARPDLFPAGSKDPTAYLATAGPAGVTPAKFWVDALVHDAAALRHLIAMFSPGRVCLGTDYPFPLGEHIPGELLASLPEITTAARDQILTGAASAFLGI